jgi:hypothetical protein
MVETERVRASRIWHSSTIRFICSLGQCKPGIAILCCVRPPSVHARAE